ncbi:DUF2087 domain-containing protein [Brachybacterium hainanense]|uniref:DUF2087 domain-containing protein n=1 Tax=Brachybacterium hainanense TaxID=1541174 RepID=A0ABV6RCR5_9MICO
MTRSSDLKKLVRARMARTGETYTSARAALLAQEAVRPGQDPAETRARAEHEKLIRPFLRDGRLLSVPARRRARTAVMIEVLARFEPGRDHTEPEVGAILEGLHPDVAYLRRELVDLGYLRREIDGSAYRLADRVPVRTGNMAQETTAWERLWLPRFLRGEAAAPGDAG